MRLILAIAFAWAVPAHADPERILPLPTPGGRHAVGTRIDHLVAPADSEFPAGRPVTLQLWYPAAKAENPYEPYLADRGLDRALIAAGYYGVDSTTVGAWSQLTTHSALDAPVAKGRFPLVTFSVGLGVIRANYTTIAEALASRGAIVALVESPLAGLLVAPDGRVVMDTTADLDRPEVHRARVRVWAEDVRFALDHLGPLAAHVTTITAAGHSSGGLVALEAMERDPRITRAVDLDGGPVTPEGDPLADVVAKGLTKPALLLLSKPLYSDADLARRGMTREQWLARAGKSVAAFDSLRSRSRAEVTIGRLAGAGHFSFSDAPFVMPSAITRFGGTPIDAQRGLDAIAAAILAFAQGNPKPALSSYPEFEIQKPIR